MRLNELKTALLRRARILQVAYGKEQEAYKAWREAKRVYFGFGFDGCALTKQVVSNITLGKFLVKTRFVLTSRAPDKPDEVDSSYDLQFTLHGDYLTDIEVLDKISDQELAAFKALKRNIDAFAAGEIEWPYPYAMKE